MLVGDELVTVAIPVYNGSKYLEQAVISIVQQSIPVKNCIIIDDASTDNIDDVVKNIKEKYNSIRITYYRNEKNIGYPSNWNLCFKYCSTKFLVILHQDDFLLQDTIEKQLKFFNENPHIALVGGLEDFINERGNIIKTNIKKENKIYQEGQIYEFVSQTGSYIPCSSVMFDMYKINKVGYFDEDVIATDELFWPKVLQHYPIAILGETLIYRRIHPEQTEYGDFIRYEKEAIKIYKKFHRIINYEQRPEFKKKIQDFLTLKFSQSYIGIAINVAKMGKPWLAIKYIGKSVKIKPNIIFYFPKMWKSFVKIGLFLVGIKLTNLK